MTLANTARRLNSARPSPLPGAVLVTDAGRLPDPAAVLESMARGSAILIRDYDRPDRAAVVGRLAAIARRRGLRVLIAADWRLAAAVAADGVHLPEGLARSGRLAPLLGWRRRRHMLLSVACHSPMALAVARRLNADAAILSPVFPTASHPGARVVGPTRFRLWVRRAGLPVHALGGMNDRTALCLLGAASGVAAIAGWQKGKGGPKTAPL